MCGIAGAIGAPESKIPERVGEMTRLLGHRGPDGCGVIHVPASQTRGAPREVALGHARLAILDLSDAGRQPMTSHDGRWTISLNGEIFNYLELRRELEAERGLRFASSTDTEVLLEGCAAWGVEATLARAVGMFAFALWDRRDHELTLARDRVGEKPLVYFWDRETLAFASEMKALAAFHHSKLDPSAVSLYLALGYVPAPLGVFRYAHKLPAGHLARWKDGQLDVARWWFPERRRAAAAGRRDLRDLVADAVRLRLRSDVPVAMALSGGLDSSVVAAELARQGIRPDAFTVVFDGDQTDLPYARAAAHKFRLRHELIRAEPGSVAEQFAASVRHYDEPFADSSSLPSLALARVLQGRYKVILNGDGGDEAFGGYPHYEFIRAKQMVKAAAAAAGLCDGGRAGVYVQSKVTFRAAERARLLHGRSAADPLDSLITSDEFLSAGPSNALKRAMWNDRHLYLANDLTYKMDIALGSAGIEGRAPFLDHRLLEWAQTLPPHQLVRGRQKKVLLRGTYGEDLPPEIVNRPKHGFGAPIEDWLRGPLAGLARTALPCPLLDPQLQTSLSGQRLWTLLTFAHWAQTWGAAW
jgi:asparagine synthase (glutamine-hydrolysing)